MNIKQLLTEAEKTLRPHTDSAKIDSEILLAFVLKKNRAYLFAWPEKEIPTTESEHFKQLILQRQQGQPIAYLVGTREFWSLPLSVNKQCLIPRPETELLVELVLSKCTASKQHILDLGTGSGAIALALATEKPDWRITAIDQSQACIDLALRNQKQLGIKNVELFKSYWYDAIQPQKFSAIVSNPPYIDSNDPHLERGDVRFEPNSSLVADGKGLGDLRAIIQGAKEYLHPAGWLFLEHGHDQATAVIQLLEENGFQQMQSHQDLNKNDRVCSAILG